MNYESTRAYPSTFEQEVHRIANALGFLESRRLANGVEVMELPHHNGTIGTLEDADRRGAIDAELELLREEERQFYS